jgi:hypothetical protein
MPVTLIVLLTGRRYGISIPQLPPSNEKLKYSYKPNKETDTVKKHRNRIKNLGESNNFAVLM